MKRMIVFFERYRPVGETLHHFLTRYGRIRTATNRSYYKMVDQRSEHWCFLLSGTLVYEAFNAKGDTSIVNVAIDNEYFSGTWHPFTQKSLPFALKFISPAVFYEIPNTRYREALKMYTDFSKIIHVLKQHEINKLRRFSEIYRAPLIDRVTLLNRYFPEIASRLTIQQCSELLDFTSSRDYYKSLKKYLKE